MSDKGVCRTAPATPGLLKKGVGTCPDKANDALKHRIVGSHKRSAECKFADFSDT